MLGAIFILALCVLVTWDIHIRRRQTPKLSVRPKTYGVRIVPEETRLLQMIQQGQSIDDFAQVEMKDGVVLIVNDRTTEMRKWQNTLILHQLGRRGGAGVELRVSLDGVKQGLCLLKEVETL
jgi:hypothetical protein